MGQRRNIVERASAWNQCASGSENTNADAIIQPRDQVFFFKVRKINTEKVITHTTLYEHKKGVFTLLYLARPYQKREEKRRTRTLEILGDKWQQFTPSQCRRRFAMKKKKYDGRIVIETHLVGARKNDIASRKWRLTKHRNSNSNSQVWIIRTSSGFKRQGTLNATVCSLSRAVVRWVFLMIRNSFNLYQLFSQSFILILERKGKKYPACCWASLIKTI